MNIEKTLCESVKQWYQNKASTSQSTGAKAAEAKAAVEEPTTRALFTYSANTCTQGESHFSYLINDVLEKIAGKLMIGKFDLTTILSFRLVDRFCHGLFYKKRPCFIPIDLGIKALRDKKKLLEFAQVNNIDGVTLKQGTANDVQHLTAFLNDDDCKELWARVEGIEIRDITIENSKLVQELVYLLALKCPKLKSFSCGLIFAFATITLTKDFTSLESFSCWDIGSYARLTLLEGFTSLNFFSCGNICDKAMLRFSEDLSNLKFFFCETIVGTLTLPKELPMLESIKWGECVYNEEVLKQLEALKAQCEAHTA